LRAIKGEGAVLWGGCRSRAAVPGAIGAMPGAIGAMPGAIGAMPDLGRCRAQGSTAAQAGRGFPSRASRS